MTQRLRCLLKAGIFCFLPFATLAASTHSPWSVYVWRSDDGLPNNDVTSLAQTSDGYLWVATDSRLARFDGAAFEEFMSRSFLPGPERKIIALLRGHHDELFLALAQGPIVCLKNGKAAAYTNNLPEKTVRSLFQDNSDALWVIYYDGTICRIKDGKAEQFNKGESGLPYGYYCSLMNDRQGDLWVLKGGKLGRFTSDHFEEALSITNSGRIRVTPSRDNGFWVCVGPEFFKYEPAKGLQRLGRWWDGDTTANPSTVMEDRNGAVWIGTLDNGLVHYDGKHFDHVATSHPQILCLLEDREGNLWAGTGGGGLDRINPTLVELQDVERGLPLAMLQSLCQDSRGTLWAVSENGLLLSCADTGWKAVTNAGRRIEMATCVTADKNGAVWIGCLGRRLLRWQNGEWTAWTRTNGVKSDNIHGLLSAKNGDLWIVGGEPTSLQCLRSDKLVTIDFPSGPHIGAVTEDAEGNLWLGNSKGGLFRVTADKVIDETKRQGSGTRAIRYLYATPDNSVWIGYSAAGLGRLKDGRYARVTTAQGLWDNHISQIVADENGWLWLGADRGIYKIWPEDFSAVAEKRDEGLQSVHYGRDEGLNSLQASYGVTPSAMRSRDGRLWFPMRTALAVVDPTRWIEDTNPPQVLLTGITVDDKTVAAYGGVMPVRNAVDLQKTPVELRFAPDHQRITFHFTALSFRSPGNVEFGYKLEGLDKNWRWLDLARDATYTTLPAGKYRFRVMACNSDGLWNETGTALAFVVTPFFWQTWWFRITVLLGFTGIAVGIMHLILSHRMGLRMQALERQAALDKERARIARDIHDDAGGHLTKIVLLSELTLQNSVTHEKVVERAKQTADAAREVLKSLDETIWAINPRNDNLRELIEYISQAAVTFLQAAGVRCRVELPSDIPDRNISAEMRHNLFLAVKEALTNIGRHAQATEAWLRVRVDAESLCVILEDNGQGFEREPDNGSADGLRNMRHRLEETGGRFGVHSLPGAGTKIFFTYDLPTENKPLTRS